MKTTALSRSFASAVLLSALAACQGQALPDREHKAAAKTDGQDIQGSLGALESATVVDVDSDGVPTFVQGQLGDLDLDGLPEDRQESVRGLLSRIAPVFRADAEDLVLRRGHVDAQGDQHLRFAQYMGGLEVLGGELVVHVRNHKVFAVNGGARGDRKTSAELNLETAAATSAALADSTWVKGAKSDLEPHLALRNAGDSLVLVYVVQVTGVQTDGTPVRDTVLVSARDGSIAGRYSHVQTALNRKLYTANNRTTTPGTLVRTEGQAPAADPIINNNYDRLGSTYNCYQQLFNRDSFDNAGAALISSVHYSTNYVNAYWDGTQMVYGDGDGVDASNLANSMDVTAHELTHAVTERTSGLVYSGESGGLNEAMSDIFGNVCEWVRDGNVVSANTWMVGEDIWTPAISGDALRYMSNPTQDGGSLDFYPDYADGIDVHYSSGIANLAFYLLSQGGTHPRGLSSTVVTGIGIEKAAQVFYKANTAILVSTSDFAGAKTATEQAATQLGYTAAEIASVTAAWTAVGVGIPVPPPVTTPLTNNVPVTGLSGSAGNKKYYTLEVPAGATGLNFKIAGNSGDADLYVRFGSAPTTSLYDCRPYTSTSNETCTITTAQVGTYYVMINAYAAYSNLTLTASYGTGGGGGGGSVLVNGVPVTNLNGQVGSSQMFTMQLGSVKPKLTFTTSGGSGNLDLYVKFGSAPTETTFDCRSHTGTNSESCTERKAAAGTWYVMIKAKTAFTGASLVGQY